ncbi:MAG TPA: MBL fold metallo-hydrolase [Candidatus Limnocylindrales bacterium]|nr:MBL fold metallo-hydrolase [Candidatus Limnocylindrales bacterium]
MTFQPMTTGNAEPDSVEFIGNATVLIRHSGFTILTDPNFVHKGEEVPLGYGLTTTRLTDPSMEIDDLPPLDLVVLSHYHGDHFDRVAEERLDRSLSVVTTPDAADTLGQKGFYNARSLETWETHDVSRDGGSLRVTALPGKHAPGAVTIVLPQVMGSLIEFWATGGPGIRFDGRPDLRLYITGDTIMYEGLREIPERHPEIDLALLHLGGARVMGLTVTMDAEQGVELMRTVRPRRAIPIHYDDYEAFKSPLENFRMAVDAAGLQDDVWYLNRGERFDLRAPVGALQD